MSLREKDVGIKSKYVKSPNGRIFLNNPNLAKLSDMSAVDVQDFEDPVPETVDQLNAMIAEAIKKPKEKTVIETNDDIFDFSKATKKQIAKKAKENFGVDLVTEDREVTELRTDYEILLNSSGNSNDDTGSGSD